MGVDIDNYLVYGIKLGKGIFDKEFEKNFPEEEMHEFLENEMCGSPSVDFNIIDDYMSGKYTVIGKIIGQLNKYEQEFIEFSSSDLPDADDLILKINSKLKTNYDRSQFKLMLFNHFW